MARIRNEEAEKYVPTNSGEWFALKNDGDTEKVQFLISDTGELDVFTAHKVKIGDKDLNDVYIESKDHSKYVKFTWYNPSSEEMTRVILGGTYKNRESDKDLSWIHYISYRDEEGIFKGNILECFPINFDPLIKNTSIDKYPLSV